MSWLYLFLASCFEICWTYSVKFARFKQAFTKPSLHFFLNYHNAIPLLGYIGFGVCNIFCFTMAIKQIPAAIAFAVWTGVAIVGLKIVDTFYLKQPASLIQLFFMALILIGIIGLKKTSPN
jgi:quaternary ammonium compound-resistance protein SugE